jgi:glucarate dehydratase
MSQGTRTKIACTIVEVETDNGLVGLGETRGDWAAAIIKDKLAPKLTGLPVVERNTARRACLPKHLDFGFVDQMLLVSAFSGIEMALWDLLGKHVNLPLFRLLGGPVRERAPFSAYAYNVDLDEGYSVEQVPSIMAELGARMIKETGSSMFEFKIGRHSVDCDIVTINTVRKAVGPDVQLAVDVNMVYTLDDARRFLEGVADADLANIEEPVAALADVETLRKEFGVPVSTHCPNLDALQPYPMIDSVVSDLNYHGGIEGTIEMIQAVRSHHRRFWLRAMWELGVAWAAMCHLGMVRPELDRPAQALIHLAQDDLILGDPWLLRDGGVTPPERPGLGVELDREALKRYAVK